MSKAVRTELYIDPAQAALLVTDGWEALRPDLVRYAAQAAEEFRVRLVMRLRRLGRGRLYLRRGERKRASVAGEAPAWRTGDYAKSFTTDTRSLKRSIQGRIGSAKWWVGRVLEYGSRFIRPRPHVRPTFEEWRNKLNRQIG